MEEWSKKLRHFQIQFVQAAEPLETHQVQSLYYSAVTPCKHTHTHTRKQTVIARSSKEAELYAAALGASA